MTLYYQGSNPPWDMGFLTGGLGTLGSEAADLYGQPVFKVTSVSGPAQAGVARLNELMARPEDVVIIQVPSDYVVPGLDILISKVGGGAVGIAPGSDPPLWAAWIDGDHCFGQGYYVYASMWKAIENYSPIILGHELAHISQRIHGIGSSEPLATMAENVHRAELGFPLRSVTNHAGGCGEPPSWIPPWLGVWASRILNWTPFARREREQMGTETLGRIPDELFPRRRAPDD